MAKSLIDTINATPFYDMTVSNVETGFNVSVEFERGKWSPHEFAATPSDAILKCFAKHAPKIDWNGECACGKTAMDGVRCSLGATHEAPPLPPLPPLPVILPPPPPY